MEPIKISISVNLGLSDDAKSFISQAITSFLTAPASKPVAQAPAPKPAAPAPKPAAPAPKPVAQAPAPKPAAPAPKPVENGSEISIEDVRKALSLKVSAHRSEIKDKLTELGAPSVTKLDPSLYQEMLDFLNTLD